MGFVLYFNNFAGVKLGMDVEKHGAGIAHAGGSNQFGKGASMFVHAPDLHR